MRALVFTLDMLVAVSIILLAVEALFVLNRSIYVSSPLYLQMDREAEDIQLALAKAKLSEVATISPVADYIADGSIGPEDLNKTLLDAAVSFDLDGNATRASSLIQLLLLHSDRFYQVDFGNSTIFSNGTRRAVVAAVGVVRRGNRLAGATKGYVSRAYSGANSSGFGEIFSSAAAAEADATARFGGLGSFETLRVSNQLPQWGKRITVSVGD